MSRIFYYVVLLVFFSAVVVRSDCPANWVQNGQSCYYISQQFNSKLPWHEAQSICQQQGGMLVVINDDNENNFVFDQIKNDQGVVLATWIGFHDLQQQDSWQWVDGSDNTYTNWEPGQPDNWQDAPAGTEDCAEFYEGYPGTWNDQTCGYTRFYVCERDFNAAISTNCNEMDGWEEFNGMCYKFYSDSLSWTAANSVCKAANSDLVSVTSQQEQTFVANKINTNNVNSWIGLSSVNHNSNQLYWSNNYEQYTEGSSYNNWLANQPQLSQDATNCIEVQPSADLTGPWNVNRCGNSNNFMCESHFTGTCADGWRLFIDRCYFIAENSDLFMNWPEANQFCKATGGQLLMIDGNEEAEYIQTRLPFMSDGGADGMWLGVSDSESDGVFKWSNGMLDEEVQYKKWGTNQPRTRDGAWDCGQIYTGAKSGIWETTDCFKRQAFVCEIETGKSVTPVDPIAETHDGCDPDWLWYNGHCYYYEYSSPQAYQQAENTCVQMGAHLVSILSNEENAFVSGHASDSAWIGLNDLVTADNFQWTDGSPKAYTDFYTGEPNDSGDCIQFWMEAGFAWDDANCALQKSFVCKKPEQDCSQQLGMEDYTIPDQQITASSIYGSGFQPYFGRLNMPKSPGSNGCWSPATDSNEYLQIELNSKQTVSGVTTQGRPADNQQFVKSYYISVSDDGQAFTDIVGSDGTRMIFQANTDHFTPITNRLPSPVVTKFVRIYPQDYEGYISMRVELIGCSSSGGEIPDSPTDSACWSVPVGDRLDCGYYGIGDQECVSKGCCWDTTVPDAPWCFYKKDDYDPRCGPGFVFDPAGSFFCYHFNEYVYRSWENALTYCYDLGAQLISIHSREEDAWVTAHLADKRLTHSFWLGANSRTTGKGWQWSDNTAFQYFNWADGEPNNYDGIEHCAELYIENAQWNDINCESELAVMCKKISPLQFPTIDSDSNFIVNVCEGESKTISCPANTLLIIHHASYGRANTDVCGYEGGDVPPGGCAADNVYQIVSKECDYKGFCVLYASNSLFGDPCYEVYKYLNVIYSCEYDDCFVQLGMEDNTISNDRITQSSSTDSNHEGKNGRLNGPSSWATNEGIGAFVQVNFDYHLRISGVETQGANDMSKWVKKFKVGFPDINDENVWNMYIDYDGNEVEFIGNTDQQTVVRNPFPEHVLADKIRIYPTEWESGIAMRFDLVGCNAYNQVDCEERFEAKLDQNSPDGKQRQVECPGGCPTYSIPKVWGTDVYTGESEICSAAIHAGYLTLVSGGPVTFQILDGQNSYLGTERNLVVSKSHGFYDSSFKFVGNKEACEYGWTPYRSVCFMLVTGAPKTWEGAVESCRSMGGDLASIEDDTFQEVVWQIIQKSDFGEAWIGLNDKRQYNQYEWSDQIPVFFTNWEPNEPNNHEGSEERCVEMYKSTGRWNDQICSDIQDYVCMKAKDYYSADQTNPPKDPEGCDAGWVAREDSCYLFDRVRKIEHESHHFCESFDASCVQIETNIEQSWIHLMIGQEDARWWIGIEAEQDEDDANQWTWKWESGDPIEYSNWGYGEPKIEYGKCVAFFGGPNGLGLWYSSLCEEHKSYTICEKQRVGFTPPPPTPPPPQKGCLGDWATPSDDDEFCYKIFQSDTSGQYDMKTVWNDARQQCLSYNADLVSIHSKSEETYLLSQLLKMEAYSEPIWIGLNKRGNIGWQWSDGSATDFTNWQGGFPKNSDQNFCSAFVYDAEQGSGKWENYNCLERFDFICMHSKYDLPITPGTLPTGQPSQACGSESDGIWMEYNGMCYLFADQMEVDSYEAAEKCGAVGAKLASIHSVEEQAFITGQINTMDHLDRYWIGLSEYGAIGGEYTWSDGTVVDYVYWSPGEPNDSGGIEQCVVVYKGQGTWNDANCGIHKPGFICKKYLGSPPIIPATPTPPKGGCGSGWYIYDNFCYKLHGNRKECNATQTTEGCLASWQDANDICKKDGGSGLASIHNKFENAFLAAQSAHATHDVWIGLNDLQWWKNYVWADGDRVDYVNWKDGEPNKSEVDDENNREECVEMCKGGNQDLGRWNDNNCDNIMPFFCRKQQSPGIALGQEINSNRKCKSGWLEYVHGSGDYSCFLLVNDGKPFDGAVEDCKKKGGQLASINHQHEQMFLTSVVRDTQAWIGLKFDAATDSWSWTDDWPVWETNWGEGFPNGDPTLGCALNKEGNTASEWIPTSCTESHAYVCKTTSQQKPTQPSFVEGYCRNPQWQVFGAFCYFFNMPQGNEEQQPGSTWAEAEAHCNREGGNLVSFTEQSELEWLLSWYTNTEPVWIGLNLNADGGWAWTSNRPVTYTNWNKGEPNDYNGGEDCVEMAGEDALWNDINCDKKIGYLCRVPKLYEDDNGNTKYVTTPSPINTNTNTSNAGLIIGVIIAVIVLLLVVVGVFKYCKDTTPVSKLTEGAQAASGFVNKLYSGSSESSSDAHSSSKDTSIRFEPNTDSET